MFGLNSFWKLLWITSCFTVDCKLFLTQSPHRVHLESGGASEHGSLVFCSSQVWEAAGLQGEQWIYSVKPVNVNSFVDIKHTSLSSLSSSAPVSESTCSACPRRRHRDPPSPATRGHPQRYLLLLRGAKVTSTNQYRDFSTTLHTVSVVVLTSSSL